MLPENGAHANNLPRIVRRWLVRLTIIVIFHLLLACSITDGIPEQWLTHPLDTSYELFVGFKEVFDAMRHNRTLDGEILVRSSLKLLLRCIDFHSMIYGFNKFHQRHEIVTLHMMYNSAAIDISGVISLNNTLLFNVMGSTLGFIVLLMQFKLSEQV
uniref:Uncharacterized protein n=1 Tax=Anopheles maculatus TaxID=74869 RepID=A0A182SJV2_9DIPT